MLAALLIAAALVQPVPHHQSTQAVSGFFLQANGQLPDYAVILRED